LPEISLEIFLLNNKDVPGLPIILDPQVESLSLTTNSGSDNQEPLRCDICSCEDGAHMEFAANSLRVRFLPFVPKYSAFAPSLSVFGSVASTLIRDPVIPSLRYSLSGSPLVFLKGNGK